MKTKNWDDITKKLFMESERKKNSSITDSELQRKVYYEIADSGLLNLTRNEIDKVLNEAIEVKPKRKITLKDINLIGLISIAIILALPLLSGWVLILKHLYGLTIYCFTDTVDITWVGLKLMMIALCFGLNGGLSMLLGLSFKMTKEKIIE